MAVEFRLRVIGGRGDTYGKGKTKPQVNCGSLKNSPFLFLFLSIHREVLRASLSLDDVHHRVRAQLHNVADVALEVAFDKCLEETEVSFNNFLKL